MFSIFNKLENLCKTNNYSKLIEAFNIYHKDWNDCLQIASKGNEDGRKEYSEVFKMKDYFENKIMPEFENAIINVKNLEYVSKNDLQELNFHLDNLKGLQDGYQAVLITDRESISNSLKVLNICLSNYKSLLKPVVEKMIIFNDDKIREKQKIDTEIEEIKYEIKLYDDDDVLFKRGDVLFLLAPVLFIKIGC